MYKDDLIRVEIARRNLKSADIARQVGISEGHFSDIKNGKVKSIKLDTLAGIARAIGLPLADLIKEEGEKVTAI